MRLLAVLVFLSCAAAASAASPQEMLDDALTAIGMTREDCAFRTDYADAPDSFRLSIADSLLSNPLDTVDYVERAAARAESASSLASVVSLCASELDLATGRRPNHAGGAIELLVSAAVRSEREVRVALSGLSEDEMLFLFEHATELLAEEEFDPDEPIDAREAEAEEQEALGAELLRVAGLVDYDRLASGGLTVARAVDAAVRSGLEGNELLAFAEGLEAVDVKALGLVEGDVLAAVETDAGLVVIGGPGSTTYLVAPSIVVDLGGDDTYRCDAASSDRDRPVSVVVDVSGNDFYTAAERAFGSGVLGVGVLVDLAGDDTYSGGSFSLGCGLFGVGLLRDASGRDSYTGDTCSQGAGAFGIGALVDDAGNDSYQAALYSQAFGFVKGFGLLTDRAGNDVYFAGGKYTDEIRYFDHFLSLSQGFGFGWRPDASGGVGLLADGGGNDVYVSDIFGQGASYWFAVGGLVDRSGNDHYVSYQYAQGAGTHITVAALSDLAGDDNYVSKGVSQGCGHDLAIGALRDASGNDSYTCHDLSQAAGNANGIGLLLDESGDDSYSVRNPDNTHGYGNLRRDYGSIGVFLDCGGSDSYGGRGGDDEWWSYSQHGIGMDANSTDEGRME